MSIEITGVPVVDEDIFLLSREELFVVGDSSEMAGEPPPTVNGRPITAVAPHPDLDDLVYVSTGPPDTLSFLPDPYVEID